MDYLTELHSETHLIMPGTGERYVMRQGQAVVAFGRPDVSVDLELECLSGR